MKIVGSQRFQGILAPVVTPFDRHLNPDSGRLISHCKWLRSQRVGLAVFGTNSEANSLSVEEKIRLLDALVEHGVDPEWLMPGSGTCALSDTVRLTRHAADLGCRGVLMLPPFYYKNVTDEGLFRYYAEVIERVADPGLQVYLYHIPPIAQVPLSLALIDRLVNAFPEVLAGIKDSSGDWHNTRALLEAGWKDFRVFCGSESFLLRTMENGGAGCISATANVNGSALVNLWENWRTDAAPGLQDALDETRGFFQDFPMIAALKATVACYSGDPDWHRLRPPLTTLSPEEQTRLEEGLRQRDFRMAGLRDFYVQ